MEWTNFDKLNAYHKLAGLGAPVDIKSALEGETGAARVDECQAPMAAGMTYSYAAKPVNDAILDVFQELADEAALTEKYAALYNGEMINTGEKRLVLHHLCRGQLGDDVIADGVNKREFYLAQQ